MHQIYAHAGRPHAARHRTQHPIPAPMTPHANAVHAERAWRQPDVDIERADRAVIASHWLEHGTQPREHTAQGARGYYVASLYMRSTQLSLSADAHEVHRGELRAGSFHVSAPGQRVCARFEAPCEILHLHLTETFVRRMAIAADALHLLGVMGEAAPTHDGVIEQLGRALLAADDKMCGWQYAERVAAPIITRYFHLLGQAHLQAAEPRRIALPRWRLQRVHAHVEQHLGGPVTLSDMATAAGLSPMHFAAQFRVATGQRPHDYLLQCRVDRAKTLLATTDRSLIDVTLEVGFCTQAHFTTVFKRFTGTTPHLWRRRNYHGTPAEATAASATIHSLRPARQA
ncbi:helix-turn-helix domain-containing protein [Dyella sp. C9]|uniref:helix-turn-helix domain-containing protein n=1 Tax=Dyella sp. C9 TaxID=2202154 RepID=UPI000DEED495|nr:AraC family transcriptional regulator [Dyella sp. C9]